MSQPIDKAEVGRCLDLLRGETAEDRVQAASQLGRMGVRTRGAVRTRGSLATPAPARMAADQIQAALQALSDAHPEVRREVAFAVGEWADDIAVTVLAELARRDEDAGVRSAAADALGKIGGPEAVVCLQSVAREDPHEDVRASAISGLGSLALASVPALGKSPQIRTRGAVRSRGGAPPRSAASPSPKSPEAERVLELLAEIRSTDASQYVRSLADSTLAGLGD